MNQASFAYNTILNTDQTRAIEHLIEIALKEARSSHCRKSNRGVVITDSRGTLIGKGHNDPFEGQCALLLCYDPEREFDICNQYAHHAEERALREARRNNFGDQLIGGTLYHLKVDVETKQPAPSGTPSCGPCARQISDAFLHSVVLLNEGEMGRHAVYTSHDFQTATLETIRRKARLK